MIFESRSFQPHLDSETKRGDTPNPERRARLALSTVRTELACARALLDELETVLHAESEERTRDDVFIQVADQLARMANTMKQWTEDESPTLVPFVRGPSASESKDRENDMKGRRGDVSERRAHERNGKKAISK
jgi:hypothetical protein